MQENQPSFWVIALKSIVTHTVTYTVMGLLASTLLDYGSRFADPKLGLLMRQTNEPIVMAGPLFQPIRGLLFAVVFYLLRDALFGKRNGWLVMWLMLAIVGILSTFGPSPGSIEGVVYTNLPWWSHVFGLPEVLLQSLLFSVTLYYWVSHPTKRWLSWVLGVLFIVLLLLPVLGLLLG